MKKYFLQISIILIILTGCSIEKRVHFKGYHVKFNQDFFENTSISKQIQTDSIASETILNGKLNQTQIIKIKEEICDSIILNDETVTIGNIKTITEEYIEFTECNGTKVFTIDAKEVHEIHFKNGEKEIIKGNDNKSSSPKEFPTSEISKDSEKIIPASIIGLALFFFFPPVALIFSIIGLSKSDKDPVKFKISRKLSIIGTILNGIFTLLYILAILLMVTIIAAL